MGDAENNSQPSKKRAAGVQLSRDNPGLDDDEETSEQEAGTFKKASDEVLATRRIVKVRRQQTSSTPSAPAPAQPPTSNPFAAIRLVPPPSAPPPSAPPPVEVEASSVASKESEQIDKIDSKSENEADEPKVESTSEKEKTDVNDDNVKSFDSQVDESKVKLNSEKDGSNIAGEQSLTIPAGDTVAKKENSKKATEDDNIQNDVAGKRNDEEKVNEKVTTEKNAETASFSSFQQLSSSQNAFSGLAGTGFSSTSFSFGSIPKDGSTLGSTAGSLFGLKNDQPSFGFGISTNGSSSIFGTLGANTSSRSEGETFPPMQEVPVETGEENEKPVFTAASVLFEFIDGTWKERGKGELKINTPITGTGKARLIMRARGNYRLILNARLFPDMKLTNMDKKGITFACVNSASEAKEGLSTIALNFKDASIVEDFRAAVMEHKDKTSVVLKTPENSP